MSPTAPRHPGPILTLLPPGGFSNHVGHLMAALDLGLGRLEAAVRTAAGHAREPAPAEGIEGVAAILRAWGLCEGAWIHQTLGGVPTPPAPPAGEDAEALLGWLHAVRTVTLMVLRPLADRDLERLLRLPGRHGVTSLRRVLAELADEQGRTRGLVEAAAALRGGR